MRETEKVSKNGQRNRKGVIYNDNLYLHPTYAVVSILNSHSSIEERWPDVEGKIETKIKCSTTIKNISRQVDRETLRGSENACHEHLVRSCQESNPDRVRPSQPCASAAKFSAPDTSTGRLLAPNTHGWLGRAQSGFDSWQFLTKCS